MSAPLYVEPVVGFRSWTVNVEANTLDSRLAKTPWPAEEKMMARCIDFGFTRREDGVPLYHPAPQAGCTCGLWGYHELEEAIENFSSYSHCLVGAAVYWGERLQVHTTGFKAQYGRIVALADHHAELQSRVRQHRDLDWTDRLERIVERYHVPVVPLEDLEAYALTYGSKLGLDYLSE